MIVGIVWPLNPTDPLDPAFLATLRATKATHLRSNLNYRNPNARLIFGQAQDAGFQLLPILDLDYDHIDVHAYAQFCGTITGEFKFDVVEILNEPRIMHEKQVPPARYAEIVAAASAEIRNSSPLTKIAVAGEMMQPDRKGPKEIDYFEDFRSALGSDAGYDLVAIHPYREPSPPETTRFKTRSQEYRHWQEIAQKPIIVTEVGWHLGNVSEAQQADYLLRELQINRDAGIGATYIYAHRADPSWDFGLYRVDGSARPAVDAIARFQDQAAASASAAAGPEPVDGGGIKPPDLDRERERM